MKTPLARGVRFFARSQPVFLCRQIPLPHFSQSPSLRSAGAGAKNNKRPLAAYPLKSGNSAAPEGRRCKVSGAWQRARVALVRDIPHPSQ
jgi:hypothetical protein